MNPCLALLLAVIGVVLPLSLAYVIITWPFSIVAVIGGVEMAGVLGLVVTVCIGQRLSGARSS